MAGWADDPELLATFRAEVDERLASLSSGLLELEARAEDPGLVSSLFRDAHTVKGSARMLGRDDVVAVAHVAEDLLAAVRDRRQPVDAALVDLLLRTADGLGAAVAGDAPAEASGDDDPLEGLADALTARLRGRAEDETSPRRRRRRRGEDTATTFSAAAAPAAPAAAVPAPRREDDPPAPPAGPAGTAPATAVTGAAAPTGAARPAATSTAAATVRVSTTKVYGLTDVVGEAELAARRLRARVAELEESVAALHRGADAVRRGQSRGLGPDDVRRLLDRLLAELPTTGRATRAVAEHAEAHLARVADVRDQAMGLAMVPVRRVTAGLPRLVRQVATSAGRDVQLRLVGEDVELDAQVLDGVADSLKHLVTNAVDHGCEPPEAREAAGKPRTATVTVTARGAGGTVSLEVRDDGGGIDADRLRAKAVDAGLLPAGSTASGPDLLPLLFSAGLSTAEQVSETSGRGVGLDVVKEAVDALGGSVVVDSERGAGTAVTLVLPVTLGVLRCLVARVGDERYAVPVPAVEESVGLADVELAEIAGRPVVVRHGRSLPLVDLGETLGVVGPRSPTAALVVRRAEHEVAWSVDRLEGETELVVKELGPFLGRLPHLPGATVDADGRVVALLDLRELTARAVAGGAPAASPAAAATVAERTAPVGPAARVLVVEDSVGVRELERHVLTGAGYEVTTAPDGLSAAALLDGPPVDLVVTDVEMPGLDGIGLTRRIRAAAGWEHVPVVVVTSRGEDEVRRAGLEAGADAYLLKHEFDQHSLVATVGRLLGHDDAPADTAAEREAAR